MSETDPVPPPEKKAVVLAADSPRPRQGGLIMRFLRFLWSVIADFFRAVSADGAGRISTGFFNPSFRVHLLIFGAAVALTFVVYSALVAGCYRHVWKVYRESIVFQEMRLETTRLFDHSGLEPTEEKKRTLLVFLQEMG